MSKFLDFFTEGFFNKKISYENIDNQMKLFGKIPSPLNDKNLVQVLKEIENETMNGKIHLLYEKYREKYGKNFLIPYLENGIVKDCVIISNHLDCEFIAKNNLKKMPNYNNILLDGILSTPHLSHWKKQRNILNTAFFPSNIKKVINISENRAKKCSQRLLDISKKNNNKIDILDFFLHETQGQLQLSLFGTTEDFSEKTNKKLRDSFAFKNTNGETRTYLLDLMKNIKNKNFNGPLSKALRISPQITDTELYGNLMTFSFAGHDTTGNTLAWLVYELCKNHKLQRDLKREIEKFWNYNDDSNFIILQDLQCLKIMSRFICETLRKWPALANGTYREITDNYYIRNNENEKLIYLPKKTYVQIPNYLRHRDKTIWKSPLQFNPYRNFKKNELEPINKNGFVTPESYRFSPFLHNNRACIGKMFAIIEMKLILLYLLKDFTFVLHGEDNISSFNLGTMAPQKLFVSILNTKSKY